jgi:hypothetical protein
MTDLLRKIGADPMIILQILLGGQPKSGGWRLGDTQTL